MRRGQALFFAVALLSLGMESVARAQEHSSFVQVAGVFGQGTGKPAFRLDLTYGAGLSAPAGQALLVFAEPSHSLLLAHVDPSFQGPEDFREALALMRGPSDALRHSVTLPYHPLTDRRIVVVLKGNDGQERVVADAKVNLRNFEFSTSFEAGPVTNAAVYHHCCRGTRCSQMCIDCETVSFTCDLIDCDIQCGHEDLVWPPKV